MAIKPRIEKLERQQEQEQPAGKRHVTLNGEQMTWEEYQKLCTDAIETVYGTDDDGEERTPPEDREGQAPYTLIIES